MFWGEKLILKDLSQLNFTASQVFKSLKYNDFQFIKSKNSRCLMVALVLHNDKKELPESIRKELRNKNILILDNPRFIIHNNGIWRAIFTIFDKSDLIKVKDEEAEIEKRNTTNKRRKQFQRKLK